MRKSLFDPERGRRYWPMIKRFSLTRQISSGDGTDVSWLLVTSVSIATTNGVLRIINAVWHTGSESAE